jgi:hypothetical protein
MKHFLSTNFFLLLRDAAQKGTEMDTQVLETEYDAFAGLLFSETALSPDKAVFHNTLCYTHAEFASLQRQQGVEKKAYPSGWIRLLT